MRCPIRLLVVVAVAGSVCNAMSAPLDLVRDGKPNAVIVAQKVIEERQVAVDEFTFPGKRNVPPMEWAKTLQSYIERITGAKLPIVENKAETHGPAIHVGLTEFTAGLKLPFDKHDRDTIFLKRVGDQIALVGVDDWGSEIAVYDFLERVCGVRWYQPSELWEIVPATNTLAVGDLDVVEEPSFKSRMFSGVLVSGSPDDVVKQCWAWLKRNRIRMRYNFHHNLGKIIDPEKFGNDHPEYFPFVGGKRVVPAKWNKYKGWQPCLTSPGVVEECVKAARAFFDTYPKAMGFSLGQNDMLGFCECPECAQANGGISYDFRGKRNYSPVYFKFINKVAGELAKTHPDKTLGCFAYVSGTITPPPFDIHPNVIFYLNPNDISRYAINEEFRNFHLDLFKKWSPKAKTYAIYLWHYGHYFYIPKLELKSTHEYLKMAHKNNARGYYAEEYPNWGLEGPKTYITARLLWNVNENIDALLDDLCRNCFGKAAPAMREFYDLAEATWNNQKQENAGMICTYLWQDGRRQAKVFDPVAVAKCRQALDRALALADTDAAKKRVEQVSKCFRVTEYYSLREFIFNSQDVPTLITPEKFAEILGNLNAMAQMTSAMQAFVQEKILNDMYSFCAGLWERRDKRTEPHLTLMRPYYFEISGRIVESLVRAEAGREKPHATQDELTAAMNKRFAEISTLADNPKQAGESNKTWEVYPDPGWPVVKKHIQNFLVATAIVPRFDSPPVIDGNADDKVWAGTPESRLTVNISNYGAAYGTELKHGTRIRLGYDDAALYVAYLCDEEDVTKLIARCDKRDSGVWEDDSIDFVLLPPYTPKDQYFHFIVNCIGACWDGQGKSDAKWDGELAVAVGKDEKRNVWAMEMAIPWKNFGKKAEPGEVWRAQFGRNNVSGTGGGAMFMEFSAWCPTDAGFDNSDYLGVLLFK